MSGIDDVFCLVPARSGSRRVKDKNLTPVQGRTLLARAVETGLTACGEVFVSTDDAAYAEVARGAGASVPALRPKALAGDDSAVEDAVRHALESWAAPSCTVVVVVQATTPFTVADDIRRAVQALRRRPEARCAVTAVRTPPTSAFVLTERPDGLVDFLAPQLAALRTQDVPPLWQLTGGVFAAWTSDLLAGGSLVASPMVPVEVPTHRALDIDDAADVRRAQLWPPD